MSRRRQPFEAGEDHLDLVRIPGQRPCEALQVVDGPVKCVGVVDDQGVETPEVPPDDAREVLRRPRRSMPAPVRPEIPASPPIKSPATSPGRYCRNALSMKRYLAADVFEVILDDFRAVDFFVPALAEREALDFLAPDFEELERAFEDDLLVVACDLAMPLSFPSPLN